MRLLSAPVYESTLLELSEAATFSVDFGGVPRSIYKFHVLLVSFRVQKNSAFYACPRAWSKVQFLLQRPEDASSYLLILWFFRCIFATLLEPNTQAPGT